MTTQTDQELLELAAYAAGLHIEFLPAATQNIGGSLRKFEVTAWHGPFISGTSGEEEWNPLGDDGDAFRLAIKCHITFRHFGSQVAAVGREQCNEYVNDDPYAASRRAVVRAAAAIGQSMKEQK